MNRLPINRGKRLPRLTPNGPRDRSGPRVVRGPGRSITPPGGIAKALSGKSASRPYNVQSESGRSLLGPRPQHPAAIGAGPTAGKIVEPLRAPTPVGAPDRQFPPGGPVDLGPAGGPPRTLGPVGGINPYTGKPLGANEYVGVAGSEAEHPGQTRIPPPGWWDPSNPNYERRAYYHDGAGNVVAIEAGYQGDAEHPFDTGRESERNTEYGRSGEGIIRMSQPGVPTWGPGQARPTPGVGMSAGPTVGASHPLLAGQLGAGPMANASPLAAALLGAQPGALGNDPNALLQQLLAALGRRPGNAQRLAV